MKYIPALNHYNHAQWLSLNVDDLLKLRVQIYIYKQFCNENFAIRKSENQFFSVAIVHERNNAAIKEAGRAVRLLSQDRDAVLQRLEIAGPEVIG